MMTVRFPNGQAVQYNTANYLIRRAQGCTSLYEKEGGRWVAQVPNSCIIEAMPACRVYDGMHSDPPQQLDRLEKELRAVKRQLAKLAK